MLLRWIRYFWY